MVLCDITRQKTLQESKSRCEALEPQSQSVTNSISEAQNKKVTQSVPDPNSRNQCGILKLNVAPAADFTDLEREEHPNESDEDEQLSDNDEDEDDDEESGSNYED